MDLLKLIAELREYRAQVEEAIASMEELARRRHPSGAGVKNPVKKSAQRREPKSKRRTGKNKSR